MSDIIDLDALTPESVTVKLGGKEVVIDPPHMSDVLRIGVLSDRLRNTPNSDLEAVEKGFAELSEAIKKCAPELEVESLSMVQLFRLVTIITSMSTPKDAQELKERKIEVGGGPKAE